MSFFPGKDPFPGDTFACDAIENLIIPRTTDIGGFSVRRALPSSRRRLVGPFIFFDRMGPAVLRPGEALQDLGEELDRDVVVLGDFARARRSA